MLFRSRDELDVDARLGEKPEHPRSDARVVLHAHADDADLREVSGLDDAQVLELRIATDLLEHLARLEVVGLSDRETHGDESVRRHVLNDDVDDDRAFRERVSEKHYIAVVSGRVPKRDRVLRHLACRCHCCAC